MTQQKIDFTKMDGLGNDFVILDGRVLSINPDEDSIREIASRDNEVTGGCDQLIIIESSQSADFFMRIYNSDGGEVGACGNASRCVAYLVGRELNREILSIETSSGILEAHIESDRQVSVDMGEPGLGWKNIPLSEDRDTLNLEIEEDGLKNPVGVSVGNPHAVFFVDDVNSIDLEKVGFVLEHHHLFPERANISVARIIDNKTIELRVWERGVGETLACGTGACATLVAAVRRGFVEEEAKILVKGGELQIIWDKETNHVIMKGEVSAPVQGRLSI